MTALLIQFLSLLAGITALTLLILAYRAERRLLAIRGSLVLTALLFLSLSYFLDQLELLTGRVELFLLAAFLNGLGSLLYIVVAPPFYHAFLGKPLTKPWRYFYATVDLGLLFFAAGLAWERYRGLAVMVLHTIFLLTVIYGLLLIISRFRALAESSLRSAASIFALLIVAIFPSLFIEPRPGLLAPFIHSHWFDSVALPLFLLLLSGFSIPFARTYLSRPPHLVDGSPTEFFLERYSLSSKEGVVCSLAAEGRSDGDIADALQVSGEEVDRLLIEILRKTGLKSRPELVTLLLANQ